MSTSSNPLAAGVPSLQPPKATQTMLSPDGQVGEIPVENVQSAVKSGFKMGIEMVSPDGTKGTIPVDAAHDAVGSGFQPAGITQGEMPIYQNHPANLFYKNIRQRETPEQIAGRQAAAQTEDQDLLHTAQAASIVGGAALSIPATIGSLAGGAVSQYAGEKSAKALGASDENAERVGDVTGLLGGIAGGIGGESLDTEGMLDTVKGLPRRALDTTKNIPWIGKYVNDLTKWKFDPSELDMAIRLTGYEAGKPVGTLPQDTGKYFPTGSVRSALEQTGDTVLSQSKAFYQQVDLATNNEWSSTETALKNITNKLQDTAGTLSDEAEANLFAKKQLLEWKQEKLADEMASHGVPEETINLAKSNYKKAQALYDVDAAVKASTRIGKESVENLQNREQVEPGKLFPRLQRLYDRGRLQDALGEQGAAELLIRTDYSQAAKNLVDTNLRYAKHLGKWGPIAATTVGSLYELLKHSKP